MVPILIADFERELVGTAYRYYSTSISTAPITLYVWEIFDVATSERIFSLQGPTVSEIIYAWPYAGDFRVSLYVETATQNDQIFKIYEDQGPIGGGGGSPPSYNVSNQRESVEITINVVHAYFQETKPLPEIVVKILGGVKME